MSQRLLFILTVVNLALVLFLLARTRRMEAPGIAAPTGQSGVLRGRALEILDDQGRVRASIQVLPAQDSGNKSSGPSAAETVLLRLIDPNGQPSVKLGTSEHEAGLSLVGGDDVSYIVLKADLQAGSLKMTTKDGRQQVLQP